MTPKQKETVLQQLTNALLAPARGADHRRGGVKYVCGFMPVRDQPDIIHLILYQTSLRIRNQIIREVKTIAPATRVLFASDDRNFIPLPKLKR